MYHIDARIEKSNFSINFVLICHYARQNTIT